MRIWPFSPGCCSTTLVHPSRFTSPRQLGVRFSSKLARPSTAALLAQPTSTAATPCRNPGDTITVDGFVRTVRKQKRIAFAAVGDGSSLDSLQVVLKPDQAEGLSSGIAVSITGQWQPSPSGKEQAHELHAVDVRILGQHDTATYPLQKKYHSPEFLRTIPHLRPRIPINALLLRMRSYIIAQITQFFNEREFIQTHPPLITSSDCEGAGEVFMVATESSLRNVEGSKGEEHFFRSPKYLTVSSQLHLEALAQSVGKVWTLSPTFRAERSDTPRHLSEFYMLEAEAVFVEKADEIMDLVEDMLRHVVRSLQTSQIATELLKYRTNPVKGDSSKGNEISAEALSGRWDAIVNGPWPRITYSNAIRILQEASHQGEAAFEHHPSFEAGLHAEHEKYLAESYAKGPIFITDYPRELKAFYMSPSSSTIDDGNASQTVACFDLLVPETCELVGGSMREHRLEPLLESMKRHGMSIPPRHSSADMPPEPTDMELSTQSLQWYLDLRRYGSVPHGGFGLGFDRLISHLAGVSNIRDVVSFPRWYGRCDC